MSIRITKIILKNWIQMYELKVIIKRYNYNEDVLIEK